MKTADYDTDLARERGTGEAPTLQRKECGRSSRVTCVRALPAREIPVPPYNRELPQDYWQSLKTGKVSAPLPWGEIWLWIKTIAVALAVIIPIVLLFVWPQPSPFPRARTDAEVAAQVQAEQALAPRAALVRLPRPSVPPARHWMIEGGGEAIAGHQYLAHLPDGRTILINFKGSVPFANALPKQPRGGANNAAYLDQATGNVWIWTVPAEASNVPEWIDP